MTYSSYTRGFTLVETLVAITILLTVITGAFSAAQSGLSGAIYSRDEIVAFYLAQEGVEGIRNIRDENGLSGRNWLTGIASVASDACYFGKACYIDAIANTIDSCSTPTSCPVMRMDTQNGFYGYSGLWALSPFTRTITLSQISADEVSILVTVAWSKGSLVRSFRVQENIMNWQ